MRGAWQKARDRRRLLRDFTWRLRNAVTDALLRRPHSVAVVIHPLSDEAGLLQRLGMSPEECIGSDAYWRYRGSVFFVQVMGSRMTDWPPGIYYRYERRQRSDVLQVVMPVAQVSTAHVHLALAALESLIDQGVLDATRGNAVDTRVRIACAQGG